MKKIILLALPILALSCSKELQPQQNETEFNGTFYATLEQGSKVGIDNLNIVWFEGDSISVFDASGGNFKFVASNVSGASCTFSQSEDTPGALSGSEFYAIYPYNKDNSISAGKITTTLKSAHTVSRPGLTSGLGTVMTAKASGNTLNFKNACALLKFSIPEDLAITGLNIILPDGAYGQTTFSVAADGTPTVSTKGSVTNLDIAAAKGSIQTGDYYIPIIPNTFAKFRMMLNYAEGTVTKSEAFSSNTLITKRNKVVNLGTLYDGRPWYKWMTFENGQIPSEITDKVGTITVIDNPLKTGNTSNKVLQQTCTGKSTSGYLTYTLSGLGSTTKARIKGIKYEFFSDGKKFCPRVRFDAASANEVQPYSINGTKAPEGGWTKETVQAAYKYAEWNVVEFRAEQISGKTSFADWTAVSIRSMVYSTGSPWDSLPATVYLDNIGFVYE